MLILHINLQSKHLKIQVKNSGSDPRFPLTRWFGTETVRIRGLKGLRIPKLEFGTRSPIIPLNKEVRDQDRRILELL